MKRLRRRIIFTLFVLVLIGTGAVYMIKPAGELRPYDDKADQYNRLLQIGKDTGSPERQYDIYMAAREAAGQALKSAETEQEKYSAEQMVKDSDKLVERRREVLTEAWKRQAQWLQRWLTRVKREEEDAQKASTQLVNIGATIQNGVLEELKAAIYIVQPQEVWQAYQTVLDETRPDPDCLLRYASRINTLQKRLDRINKERAGKKLKPVTIHYFGNPATVNVDAMSKAVTFKFAKPGAAKLYANLYNNPPDDLTELDLMRLRYVHRAVREQLELQIWEFAHAMRPPGKILVVAGPERITDAERERARRIIFEDIKEMLDDGRMAKAFETRKVEWRHELPARLTIDQKILWATVDLLLAHRAALQDVLGRLRSVVLRPLRQYPDPETEVELYIEWLKKKKVIVAETRQDRFRWVKRLRPVDIFFNTTDGYMVYSFEFPRSEEHPDGWRAECVVLLKQEIDTAWLIIGFESGGAVLKEWREGQDE